MTGVIRSIGGRRCPLVDWSTLPYEAAIAGDREAQQQVVLGYLPFVQQQARRFMRYECPQGTRWGESDYMDYVHDGLLAVYKALDRFDPNRGSFSRFLSFYLYRTFGDRLEWSRRTAKLSFGSCHLEGEEESWQPGPEHRFLSERREDYCPTPGCPRPRGENLTCKTCERKRQRNGICQTHGIPLRTLRVGGGAHPIPRYCPECVPLGCEAPGCENQKKNIGGRLCDPCQKKERASV